MRSIRPGSGLRLARAAVLDLGVTPPVKSVVAWLKRAKTLNAGELDWIREKHLAGA